MKWINAEQQVSVTIYDEEHEEHLIKTMTVEEMLDTYTNEGCPITYPSVESKIIRCKDCKHWINHHLCESLSRYGTFETKAEFFCGYAERRTDGTD